MNNFLFFSHTSNERMVKMEILYKVCLVLAIIGAIYWGLIGLFDFILLTAIFEAGSVMTKIIYSLVGISGLVSIGILFHHIDSHPFE